MPSAAEHDRLGDPLGAEALGGGADPGIVALAQHDPLPERGRALPQRLAKAHRPIPPGQRGGHRRDGPARSRRRRTGRPRARGSSSGRSGRRPAPGRPSPATGCSWRFISAIWNSYSKSLTARSPRTTIEAPTFRANSASSPSNDSKATRGSSPIVACSNASRSATREERLLRRVDRDRDDDPVGERQAPPDQVLVAPRRRIERARVDRDAGHGAWQKVRAVSP